MPLLQLAYVSQSRLGAINTDSLATLAGMMAKARRLNRDNGVTGYLLFDGVEFAQILEGEASAVDGTYLRISRDRRHMDLKVVLRRHVPQRLFAAWDMGLGVREGSMMARFAELGFADAGTLGEAKPETLLALFTGMAGADANPTP